MPDISGIPGSPEEWMAKAMSDLKLAMISPPEGVQLEDLCFHAQQAGEKALKAVYKHHNWNFPYTHDLDILIDGLKQHRIEVPGSVESAVILSNYAWQARYPGMDEPINGDELREAVQLATAVVQWASEEMGLPLP